MKKIWALTYKSDFQRCKRVKPTYPLHVTCICYIYFTLYKSKTRGLQFYHTYINKNRAYTHDSENYAYKNVIGLYNRGASNRFALLQRCFEWRGKSVACHDKVSSLLIGHTIRELSIILQRMVTHMLHVINESINQ